MPEAAEPKKEEEAKADKPAEPESAAPSGEAKPAEAAPEGSPNETSLPSAEADRGVSAEQVNQVGKVAAKQVFFVDKQEIYKQYISAGKDVAIRPFSRHHRVEISAKEEREVVRDYVKDDAAIGELWSALQEKRLLVVTGEPEQGKTTAAIYLSYRLRAEEQSRFSGSYLVHPLERSVKIIFDDIIENKDEFGGRMLFFRDAFAQGNRDVSDFFTRLDRHLVERMSKSLRNNDMFLLFTADSPAGDLKRKLSGLGIEQELPPLGEDLLMEGLEFKLAQFPAQTGVSAEELESILDAAKKRDLIQRLRTMPRIVQFVDNYLLKLKDGLDFKLAIDRIDNLKGWFLTELADDFDSWCFALCLGLCQCLPLAPGVPWFEFEAFRKAMSFCLAKELKPGGRRGAGLREAISEEYLLARCRAEVYKDPNNGVDCVRFSNERYPEMLWRVFLGSNRRILNLLLPQLTRMAQLADPAVRQRAAQILGRVGEMDPLRITFGLMGDWIRSDDRRQQATVGSLYQGVLASKNSRYRNDCLRELSSLSEEEDKPELWTAIAAYRQIGEFDLPLAMGKFRQIAERKLVEPIDNTRRLDKILNRIENVVKDHKLDAIDSMALAAYHTILREIADRVYNQEGPILFAIQYAIVSLCLALDPLDVLGALEEWITSAEPALGGLAALIFLQENGIAEELERRRVEIPRPGDDTDARDQSCNPLVISIASSHNSVRRMARFLESMFGIFSSFFPPRSRQYLRKSFLFHLKAWAKDSSEVDVCRSAIEQLFAELLASSNRELSDQLFSYLRADSDFAPKDGELSQFAKAVFKRNLGAAARRIV